MRAALVVITRDKRIRYRPVEKRAWLTYVVRGFGLTGTGSQSTADSVAILDRHWQTMMTIIESDPEGPWMHAVTSGGLRPIDLAQLRGLRSLYFRTSPPTPTR